MPPHRPRLLIASVSAAPSAILSAHLKTVRTAAENCDADVSFLYLIDSSAPEAQDRMQWALKEADIPFGFTDPKPQGAEYAVSEQTHLWREATFYWLGAQKDKLLRYAEKEGFDYIFLTDSDLLLGPDTLASLLACRKPVVSAVFWTKWQPDSPPLPQVWRQHPYGFDGMGEQGHEFLRKLEDRSLLPVRGLGACTLIDAQALPKLSFAPVEGLPREGMWQGEDRAFCIRAEAAHVDLWADAWPDIFHVYRPSDQQSIEHVRSDILDEQPQQKAFFGDLVSLTLEPLEEPQLASHVIHVRGRLGALTLLPDLEQEVLSMKVGDNRLIPLTFPAWYPIESYRTQKRLIRVRLLGAKPFRKPLPDGLSRVVEATP